MRKYRHILARSLPGRCGQVGAALGGYLTVDALRILRANGYLPQP